MCICQKNMQNMVIYLVFKLEFKFLFEINYFDKNTPQHILDTQFNTIPVNRVHIMVTFPLFHVKRMMFGYLFEILERKLLGRATISHQTIQIYKTPFLIPTKVLALSSEQKLVLFVKNHPFISL